MSDLENNLIQSISFLKNKKLLMNNCLSGFD